jgi:hypothetical protein
MADLKQTDWDDAHETIVREYLSSELDRQLGGAENRFRQFLQQEQTADDRRRWRITPPGGWIMSFTGVALAACLAVVLIAPTLHTNTKTAGPAQNGTVTNSTPVAFPWIQREVDGENFDGGTYLDENGQPVQVVRRREWERTRWFDDNKQLRAEEVVPHDGYLFVPVKTY